MIKMTVGKIHQAVRQWSDIWQCPIFLKGVQTSENHKRGNEDFADKMEDLRGGCLQKSGVSDFYTSVTELIRRVSVSIKCKFLR